jgi:hypothetical protein
VEIIMDFVYMLNNAFNYAMEGLVKNPIRWLILVILSVLPMIPWIGLVLVIIIVIMSTSLGGMYGTSGLLGSSGLSDPSLIYKYIFLIIGLIIVTFIASLLLGAFYVGYLVRILHGDRTMPEVTDYKHLFIDGIKFNIIQAIYLIPSIIIFGATVAIAWLVCGGDSLSYNPSAWITIVLLAVLGLFLAGVIAIILGLLWVIGIVRFARTGGMGQAFKFREILTTIKKIGWGPYLIALIILVGILVVYSIAFGIISAIASIIPFVGIIFYLGLYLLERILTPFVAAFLYRYISLLYDNAGST